MRDPRYAKLADVLVRYSTQIQPGNVVLISGSPVSTPLLVEIYRRTLAAGGHPLLNIQPDVCKEILLSEGSDAQLMFVDPVAQYQVETIDASITAWGPENTKSLSQITPESPGHAEPGPTSVLADVLTALHAANSAG